jgi:hypothetical protein
MAAVLHMCCSKQEQRGPGAVLDLTQEEDRKLTPGEAQLAAAAAANEVIIVIIDDDSEGDVGERLPPMTLQRMMRYTNTLRRAEEYKAAATGTAASEAYKGLAAFYLGVAFPGLARAVAEETLTAHGHRFFKAREHLRSVLYGDILHPDKMVQRGKMTDAEMTQIVTDRMEERGWLAAERDELVDLTLEDEQFGRELEFTAQFDAMERYEVDRAVAEARLLEQQAGGDRMECNCCFGDYVLGALVQCTEGHVFCRCCLRRYALTRLFEEQRTALSCMFIPSNGDAPCMGHFPESQLLQVLSPKVYTKYTELQAAEALREADIAGLVSCPRCPFQGIADGDGGVLKCPDCKYDSCLVCHKEAHPGLQCETDADTERRRRVEEAMTTAKVRMCPNPKCRKEFVKISGCNEITCPACKTKSCYVCRQRITKHTHFCGRAFCRHIKCGKCSQFTDPDDDVAMARAAALANLETGTGRQVDVGRLLARLPPLASKAPRKRKR